MKRYLFWKAPLSKAVMILEDSGKGSKLYWYGITFGYFGIGVLVMRKEQTEP